MMTMNYNFFSFFFSNVQEICSYLDQHNYNNDIIRE